MFWVYEFNLFNSKGVKMSNEFVEKYNKWDSAMKDNEKEWTDEYISLLGSGDDTFVGVTLKQFMGLKVFQYEFGNTMIKDAVDYWEECSNKKLSEDDYLHFCWHLFNKVIIEDGFDLGLNPEIAES